MVIDVALLDVVEETVLLECFLPEADDVVLGLAGGGGQQVGDGLEDGADGLGRDAFFLGLYAECGDQRGQLLDVNHNQNSFAILLRKATLIGRCGKRQDFRAKNSPPRSSHLLTFILIRATHCVI